MSGFHDFRRRKPENGLTQRLRSEDAEGAERRMTASRFRALDAVNLNANASCRTVVERFVVVSFNGSERPRRQVTDRIAGRDSARSASSLRALCVSLFLLVAAAGGSGRYACAMLSTRAFRF